MKYTSFCLMLAAAVVAIPSVASGANGLAVQAGTEVFRSGTNIAGIGDRVGWYRSQYPEGGRHCTGPQSVHQHEDARRAHAEVHFHQRVRRATESSV